MERVYAVGDSMYPLIKSGDIVIFRKINDMENNIFWGEMYLLSYDLEGEEYIVIKYLHESEKPGFIKLVSQNQYHSPKDIPLNRVRALAQIAGVRSQSDLTNRTHKKSSSHAQDNNIDYSIDTCLSAI